MAAPPSASRKRKRTDDHLLLGDPFSISPHPSSALDAPTKVAPAVVLPRTRIPLAWLAGAPSRIFSLTSANMPALDVPGNVLIMKIEGERQLCAVEKMAGLWTGHADAYVLYRLSVAVKMKEVRKLSAVVKKECVDAEGGAPIQDNQAGGILSERWWMDMGEEDACPFDEDAYKVEEGYTISNASPSPETLLRPPSPMEDPFVDEAAGSSQRSPVDGLAAVRDQYYEALYLAKTSLAYFAKSTLSRARVAYQQQAKEASSGASSGCELVAFLQEMIMPLERMDAKYKRSLLELALDDTSVDPEVFMFGEENYALQWRELTFGERVIARSNLKLKKKIEELKIRETELQIILLLEILALRKDQPPADVQDANEGRGKKKSSKGKRKEKKGKGKKKAKGGPMTANHDMMLDLFVDRLCIWSSIGSSFSEFKDDSSDGETNAAEEDHLRHFSVEVIMAFYASKLPEKCASIHRKFGGTTSGSTTKRGPADSVSKKDKSTNPRRAATTKKAARPSLTRSSTAPAGMTERATSEALSAAVAADAASQSKRTRGGTLNTKSFAKRTVQVETMKALQKKKEEVNAQLKNAISALKRPNRAALASEMVDAAERRLAGTADKRVKKPLKPAVPSNVQVMATPKKRRYGNPLSPRIEESPVRHPHYQPPPPFALNAPKPLGAASNFSIAETPRRGSKRNFQLYASGDGEMAPSTSSFLDNGLEGVASTPLASNSPVPARRNRSGKFARAFTDSVVQCTPLGKGCENRGAVPPSADRDDGGVKLFDGENEAVVSETPVGTPTKRRAVESVLDTPAGGVSLYQRLGWEDDFGGF